MTGLRKFSADQLFDGYHFTGKNTVLIVAEDGTIVDLIARVDAGDDVLHLPGILSPGFINCHCHLELSHMRGLIPETTGLVQFVINVVQNRHTADEKIMSAIENAEDEMLSNGIVAVGDICNNSLTIPQKIKGRIYYHNFIEASGFDPAVAKERFNRSVTFFKEYARHYSIPIESNSIVPHAPYSVSDKLWEMIVGFPGNHLMTIHNQETEGENEWFKHKQGELSGMFERMKIDETHFQATGKSSLQSFLPAFLPNQSIILVHNVHTDQDDISFAKNSGKKINWCLCPNANRYITGAMPPVELLIKNDCNIVLGTDSLASNHQLSISSEIKTVQKYFPSINLETMLTWATSNGAKALQVDSFMGSFEKEKTPGLVLLDPHSMKVKRIL
jgi:cytosine/adenosine deaminase-related metal-dependent hydrolase